MAINHWIDDDAKYENWLAEHPDGFMANLNREPRAGYFRIHRATHRLPDRSNPGSVNPRTGNTYSKVTADTLSELRIWAENNIPSLVLGAVNYCKTCNPDTNSDVELSPTTDPNEYVHRANQILARGHVARPAGSLTPKVDYASTAQFYRDPKVRAWVLQRAKGCCELCHVPAPFLTDDEDLYLESHHLVFLADGGADTPENTAALCPNCHRKMHYGKDRISLCESLGDIVYAKESAFIKG